jgi:hypothetical protein
MPLGRPRSNSSPRNSGIKRKKLKLDFRGKGGITARFATKPDPGRGAGRFRTKTGWYRTSRAKLLIPA